MLDDLVKQACSPLLYYLRQHPEIKQAILFGSLATGNERFESDIDLAVELNHVLSAIEKQNLIQDIALITGRAVDLIDLKTVGQALLGQILQHGERLVNDDIMYADLLSKYVLNEADFEPYRQRILDERRQAWIGC